jgi:hypothetical protein
MAAPVFCYNLTLKEPSLVTRCCYGSFSGEKKHELVAVKGSFLELLSVDDTGRLTSLLSVIRKKKIFFFFFFFLWSKLFLVFSLLHDCAVVLLRFSL